jgi:hypothetical protein
MVDTHQRTLLTVSGYKGWLLPAPHVLPLLIRAAKAVSREGGLGNDF